MAFSNLGFETEDAAAPGFPDEWTVSLSDSAEEAAGYDDGDETPNIEPNPFEGFEGGWESNQDFVFAYEDPADLNEIDPASYDSALPDSESFEDYEEGWDTNQNFLTSFGSSEAASFDSSTPEEVEDYEEEWSSNGSFFFEWGDTSDDAASFDSSTPEEVEDYEEEWDDNESFFFVMGANQGANYDGSSPEAVEDFEETAEDQVVTVVTGTDRVNLTGHGISDGEKVTFRNENGTLPEGISPKTTYFVVNSTADDFQVSASSGGSAVDITDAGTGTHFVRRDPDQFWIDFMETI